MMETKKNKKYDLERKRPTFFGIGMIISLSLALVAFEWKSEIEPIVIPREPEDEDWAIYIDPVVTRQPEPEPPKPLKEEKKIINQATIIKEVTEEIFEPQKEEIIDQGDDIIDLPIEDFGIKEEVEEAPFLIVEEMPSFPGGIEALYEQIAKNLKYPKQAQRIGVEGRVTLTFVVDKDGSITNIEVMKGIGAGCDEEAIRVLKSVPNFSPGKQRGKPVKVQMQLPITFRLH